MVIGLLGELGDAGDERDRFGERRELVRLHDLVAVARPARKRFEALVDGVVWERRHRAPGERLELSTYGLTVRALPIELPRNGLRG